MKIQHLKHPFSHTIIYGFFNDKELLMLKEEALSLLPLASSMLDENTDPHHKRLYKMSHTLSMCVDKVFETDRTQSFILELTRYIFELCKNDVLSTLDNEFIEYIPESNCDQTYLQFYQDGSNYFSHKDNSVISILYPLYLSNEFEGGNLVFDRFGYRPNIQDNCCLIFPSYQPHSLDLIKSKAPGYVRASINQRIFISNN